MPSRRQAPEYDWDNDGSASKQGSGIYILKPEVQAVVKKPSWWGTETVFRPYPCVSFQNPETEFEPYRIVHPDGRNRFSDFIRRYPCAWGIGQNATTFLMKKTHRLYDVWTSPLGILYKAIENACRKGEAKDPRWYPLRESGMNRGKALRPPSDLYLMQGILLRHDKTEFAGKGQIPLGWNKNPTFILMLSMDAGKVLADELNKEKEGFAGSPVDFESRYVHGDPVSPLNGRFMHFWERGSAPPSRGNSYTSKPTQQTSSFEEGLSGDGSDAAVGGASKEMPKKGFDLEMTTHYGGRIANFNKAGEDQIRSHWQHWDDILYFPTEVEQAHILSRCFPATAIIYAFESVNRDWISDECWHEIRKPKSANFRDRVEFEEPPAEDDPFGAPTQATQPASSRAAAAAAATQRPAEADAWSDLAENGAHGGAEDSSVPQRSIDTAVAEPAPSTPTPRTATDGNESMEAKIARLASARNKIK